jgi:hypothetical protein
MTEQEIEKLEALAKAAPKGNWSFQPGNDHHYIFINNVAVGSIWLSGSDGILGPSIETGLFIAAANPATILALTAENKRLREKRPSLEEIGALKNKVWNEAIEAAARWHAKEIEEINGLLGREIASSDGEIVMSIERRFHAISATEIRALRRPENDGGSDGH